MTEKRFYLNEGEVGILKILDLKEDNEAIYHTTSKSDMKMVVKLFNRLSEENKQLKEELLIYRKIANCSNCKYQNYNWFEDGDEFEICEKGNNEQKMEYYICKEWEEFE